MSDFIIVGAFNFAGINWDSWFITKPSTATDHRYFLKFLLEKSLSQLGKVVTRPPSISILDLFTTTNPNLDDNIETHTGISDHLQVILDISMKTIYDIYIYIYQYIYIYHILFSC